MFKAGIITKIFMVYTLLGCFRAAIYGKRPRVYFYNPSMKAPFAILSGFTLSFVSAITSKSQLELEAINLSLFWSIEFLRLVPTGYSLCPTAAQFN